MKKLVAENSFWELFPDAAIGILAVRDMRPAAEVPPEDAAAVARLLRDANEQANRHLTSNTISVERYLGASIEVRAVVDRAHPELVIEP